MRCRKILTGLLLIPFAGLGASFALADGSSSRTLFGVTLNDEQFALKERLEAKLGKPLETTLVDKIATQVDKAKIEATLAPHLPGLSRSKETKAIVEEVVSEAIEELRVPVSQLSIPAKSKLAQSNIRKISGKIDERIAKSFYALLRKPIESSLDRYLDEALVKVSPELGLKAEDLSFCRKGLLESVEKVLSAVMEKLSKKTIRAETAIAKHRIERHYEGKINL